MSAHKSVISCLLSLKPQYRYDADCTRGEPVVASGKPLDLGSAFWGWGGGGGGE